MADYTSAKAEYIRGGISYSGISAKYGMPLSSLKRVAAREHWTELRDQVAAELIPKMLFHAAEAEAKQADRIQTIADRLLQKIEANIDEFAIDSTSMRQITAAIKDLREIKGQKTAIDIEEQRARIDKLRRDAAAEEKSSEIRVVISDDLKDYTN